MIYYTVKTKFTTIRPMFEEKVFEFSDKEEALKFCRWMHREGHEALSPVPHVAGEMFDGDTAINWVKDEIKGVQEHVLKNPQNYSVGIRARARAGGFSNYENN